MSVTESIRNIKSMQDIGVEKARLRYESLIAEKSLADTLQASEKVFTFFSFFRYAADMMRIGYNMFVSMYQVFDRLFGRYTRKKSKDTEEAKTINY